MSSSSDESHSDAIPEKKAKKITQAKLSILRRDILFFTKVFDFCIHDIRSILTRQINHSTFDSKRKISKT
jgi:hypothetical protein